MGERPFDPHIRISEHLKIHDLRRFFLWINHLQLTKKKSAPLIRPRFLTHPLQRLITNRLISIRLYVFGKFWRHFLHLQKIIFVPLSRQPLHAQEFLMPMTSGFSFIFLWKWTHIIKIIQSTSLQFRILNGLILLILKNIRNIWKSIRMKKIVRSQILKKDFPVKCLHSAASTDIILSVRSFQKILPYWLICQNCMKKRSYVLIRTKSPCFLTM